MSVPGKLAREIARVTELRCRYEEVARMPNVFAVPQIAMMRAAIEQACQAADSSDIEGQIKAIQILAEFEQ